MTRKRDIVVQRMNFCIKKYCEVTSLHGFRYVTDPKSSRFKSYFWTLVCIISTCLCFILIRSQFVSFYSNRIATTIETTAFPIWEVPFPAVTLCNFNVVYKNNVKQFKDLLQARVTSVEIDNFFSNLSSLIITNRAETDLNWSDFSRIAGLLNRAGFSTEQLMARLMQPCGQMISDCSWNAKLVNCTDIFFPTKTSNGYCCSFNYNGIKNQPSKADNSDIFASGVGPSFGLSARLHVEPDQYVSPLDRNLGIDVSVHQSLQYPDMSIFATTVHPGQDISLSIKPEMTRSDDSVKGINIASRGCAFSNEIKMEWTDRYSYSMCINECKAKAIKYLCNCVPYYYYQIKGWSRFCTLSDMACILKNTAKFKSSKLTFYQGNKLVTGDSVNCKCFPQCNEISYSYQRDGEMIKTSDGESNPNISTIRVYFGYVSCTKYLRNVLITWELIVASVGGLIGLCLGGSILSIIEFFYNVAEAVFSRYPKRKVEINHKPYKPKLYLTDFGRHQEVRLGQIQNKRDYRKQN